VIGYWSPEGKLVGCVVNFACHANDQRTVGGANWIYYMERVIQGFYGPRRKSSFSRAPSGCDPGEQHWICTPNPRRRGGEMVGGTGGRRGFEGTRRQSQHTDGDSAGVRLQET